MLSELVSAIFSILLFGRFWFLDSQTISSVHRFTVILSTIVCNPSMSLGGSCPYPHFADEETKAQSGLVTSLMSHSKWNQGAHQVSSPQDHGSFYYITGAFIIPLNVMSTHFIVPFAKYL